MKQYLPVLLNEMQKQQVQLQKVMHLQEQVQQQQQQLAELLRRNDEVQAVNQAMQSAIVKLQEQDERMASR